MKSKQMKVRHSDDASNFMIILRSSGHYDVQTEFRSKSKESGSKFTGISS